MIKLCKPSLLQHLSKSFVYVLLRSVTSKPIDTYWDYSEEYGPSYWTTKWKTGKYQSPIELLTEKSVYKSLNSFDVDVKPLQWKAVNNGNNVSMKPISDEPIQLGGGPLLHKFELFEMHLHWGEMNVCGCEHVINGVRNAGELHIVHWNRELYNDASTAARSEQGLGVLGVHLSAKENHSCHQNFQRILAMFEKVHGTGSETVCEENFSPYDLLPTQPEHFFTYPGSLTTPPLTENVTWTIFLNPINISIKQWEMLNNVTFKSLQNERDRFCRSCKTVHTITNNFRPTQDVNDRVVHRSFK